MTLLLYVICVYSISVLCDDIAIYNNSSWHWGSYGNIWTGPSRKKYYMDRSFWGPYNICLVTNRSIYCHMTRRKGPVNLVFIPVFKPHTHKLYILRHWSNISIYYTLRFYFPYLIIDNAYTKHLYFNLHIWYIANSSWHWGSYGSI
jgi:hypothetical protein